MNRRSLGPGLVQEAQPPGRVAQRLDHTGQRLDLAPGMPPSCRPSSASEMSIESSWTSIPTNMRRFAMACPVGCGSPLHPLGVAQSTIHFAAELCPDSHTVYVDSHGGNEPRFVIVTACGNITNAWASTGEEVTSSSPGKATILPATSMFIVTPHWW